MFTRLARLADGMITGGSSSVRATGQHTMRIAGAAARHMLVAAAAQEWGVPANEIATANSVLSHKPSGRTAPYARFAAAAAEQDMPLVPAQVVREADPRLEGAGEGVAAVGDVVRRVEVGREVVARQRLDGVQRVADRLRALESQHAAKGN